MNKCIWNNNSSFWKCSTNSERNSSEMNWTKFIGFYKYDKKLDSLTQFKSCHDIDKS